MTLSRSLARPPKNAEMQNSGDGKTMLSFVGASPDANVLHAARTKKREKKWTGYGSCLAAKGNSILTRRDRITVQLLTPYI